MRLAYRLAGKIGGIPATISGIVQLGSEPSNPYDFSAEDWTPLELDAWIIANSTLTDATILLPNVPRSYYSSTAFTTIDANNTVTYLGSTLADTDAILAWYADNSITYETIDLSDYDARTSASDTDKATIIANYNDLSVNDPAGSSFPIADADLVALWDFDDASGTTVTDEIGTNNGTATNTTIVSGIVGDYAREFSGSSSGVTFGSNPAVFNSGMTNDFTISTWVNFSSLVTAVYQQVVLSRIAWNNYVNIYKGYGTYIVVHVNYDGTDTFYQSSTISASTNYHIMLSWNATAHTIDFYLNGVLQTNSSTDLQGGSVNGFYIGRSGSGGSPVAGIIDQTFIMNRQCTAQEALDVYNSGNGIVH